MGAGPPKIQDNHMMLYNDSIYHLIGSIAAALLSKITLVKNE